jgi:hypothetical protein
MLMNLLKSRILSGEGKKFQKENPYIFSSQGYLVHILVFLTT